MACGVALVSAVEYIIHFFEGIAHRKDFRSFWVMKKSINREKGNFF
jgi:hypothetical protein